MINDKKLFSWGGKAIKIRIACGNENIHNMWYLPVSDSKVHQNINVKDNDIDGRY
jgi:hypothetical protein